MNPATTAIQFITPLNFKSYLTTLPTTLGISHTLFIIILIAFFLPMLTFFIWRLTRSFALAMLATLGGMIALTVMGIIPLWVTIIFGIMGISPIFLWISDYAGIDGSPKRKIYKNFILCKFIDANGIVVEKWINNREQKVEFNNGLYMVLPKYTKIEFSNGLGSKAYPVIYFKTGQVFPIENELELEGKARKEYIAMTNQLIQDPNKIGIKPTSTITITSNITTLFSKKKTESIDFDSISFAKGTKSLSKLNTIHQQVLDMFSNDVSINFSLVDVAKVKGLELDIYNQGINVLKQVYEIASQLQQTKIDELNETHADLTSKLATLDKSSPMYSLMNDRLDINNKSLGMIKKYNDRTDELLCQVDLYIESISEMCLELPELINHQAQGDMDAKIRELNDRIAMAQRIKDEYNKEKI